MLLILGRYAPKGSEVRHSATRFLARVRHGARAAWSWLGRSKVQHDLGITAALLLSFATSLAYHDLLFPSEISGFAEVSSQQHAGLAAIGTPSRKRDAAPPVSAAPPEVTVKKPARRLVHRIEGKLAQGETLAGALQAKEVAFAMVQEIDRGMRHLFDFRRAQPGHHYQLFTDARTGDLVRFTYEVTALERYRFEPDGAEYRAYRLEVPIKRREARLAGVVTTSLYDAVQDLGESPQVASDFAAIFAWDLDFSRAVRPGDQFRILYERNYLKDGKSELYMGPGRILAASYAGAGGELHAVYFEGSEGRGGYFRPNGHSVERRFLAAPLNYSRISSAFSPVRLHPILKVKRPHHGIDYAAPVGTPVWAVADGEVIYRGWAKGFGRLVKIRHRKGYVSYYAHLSRYAPGLEVGQVVQQKQVIGNVGQSGLATGPHVCFRVQQNGRYVNPASIEAPTAEPIAPRHFQAFAILRDRQLARLGPMSMVATDEAM